MKNPFAKSVDGIMSSFTKAITDLQAVQAREATNAERHTAAAVSSSALAAESIRESARASNLASKLSKAFGI